LYFINSNSIWGAPFTHKTFFLNYKEIFLPVYTYTLRRRTHTGLDPACTCCFFAIFMSGTRVKYTIYFATLAPRTSVYGYGPNEPHSILMLAQLLRRGSRWNALLLVLHFYTFVASYVKSSLSEKRRVKYVCMSPV